MELKGKTLKGLDTIRESVRDSLRKVEKSEKFEFLRSLMIFIVDRIREDRDEETEEALKKFLENLKRTPWK